MSSKSSGRRRTALSEEESSLASSGSKIINTGAYADSSYEYRDRIDPTLEFLYRPHTLSALLLLIISFVYVAFFVTNDDTVVNFQVGLTTGIIVFLIVGVLEFRNGPFIRPHPAFWKLILAASTVYQVLLTFILFQSKHDVRHWLTFLDPSLGKSLPERSYAENCELTWNNARDQIDVFVLAHVLGWYAKAIVLRDYWFCWILSVMFEIMEYSLQHQLPNFAECWWDHWILDVLVCNWLGTYFGMKTCQYFEMKHYSWRGIKEIPSYSGKLKRSMAQFTPHSWTKFEWGTTKNFKTFMAVIGLLYMVLQCELNAFYLKYLLWIPPENKLNVYRLILFFFMCIPATREAYQYLTDPNCKRFGMHAWMTTANILTELLICIKFGKGEFPQPHPPHVVWFWIILTSSVVIYAVWTFGISPRLEAQENTMENESPKVKRRAKTLSSIAAARVVSDSDRDSDVDMNHSPRSLRRRETSRQPRKLR